MTKFTITWLEKKNPDWIVAQLKDDVGLVYEDVSINRKDKKGGPDFPNFDGIMNGGTIEGESWKSQSQKWYLFPPKPVTPQGGAIRGSGAINKAMETKSNMIKSAQENKELGIMTSSTMRMAVDIALQEVSGISFDVGVFKGRINFWREWLLEQWDLK